MRISTMSYALIFFFCLRILPGAAQLNIEGEWIGGWQVKGDWVSVKAQFKNEKGRLGGSIDLQQPDGATQKLALTKIALEGSRFRLEAAHGADVLSLDGEPKDGVIAGNFQQGKAQGRFELLRVVKVDPKLFDQYVGSYRLSSDNFISIGRQTNTGGNLRLGYVERASGRRGHLIPLAENIFVGGPALGVGYPIDVKGTFVKNAQGEVTGLKWRSGGSAEKTATKINIREEEVRFRNGEHALAGTLLLPPTKGPHPALIFAHGSTPLVRYYFGADPYIYPVYGLAVLIYDKRGVGASTGQRSEAIMDLAADVLAGVEYLKTRVEIDPKQIGLHGHSQGGWVAPEAAARSKDIVFIIAGAASGLSVFDNQVYEVASALKFAGFSEKDRADALALFKRGNEVILAGGAGWNEWREAIAKIRDEKWFPHARTPNSLSEMNEANRARIMSFIERERRANYDPVPVWEKITIPVFVYQGELDRDVPAQESAAIIGRALEKAANRDFTIKVFPKANHGLWAAETGGPLDKLTHKVHYDLLIDWIRNHVRVRE